MTRLALEDARSRYAVWTGTGGRTYRCSGRKTCCRRSGSVRALGDPRGGLDSARRGSRTPGLSHAPPNHVTRPAPSRAEPLPALNSISISTRFDETSSNLLLRLRSGSCGSVRRKLDLRCGCARLCTEQIHTLTFFFLSWGAKMNENSSGTMKTDSLIPELSEPTGRTAPSRVKSMKSHTSFKSCDASTPCFSFGEFVKLFSPEIHTNTFVSQDDLFRQ